MNDPFIGGIIMFAGNFAPRGWAFCDGQLLPISQYSALFSILGTTYGGDGRTTFALPDLRGRAVLHEGQSPGTTYRNLGSSGGTETVTLNTSQMPLHNHGFNLGGTASSTSLSGQLLAESSSVATASSAGSNNDLNASTIANAGGSQPHNNMQPYAVVNYIIALVGTYPSRS